MKTTFPVIVIRPKAALQLAGRRPDDYATPGGLPRSDLLFAALCQAWALLGLSEPLRLLEQNPESSGLWLSSTFPYVSVDGSPHYLWPRPLIPAPSPTEAQEKTRQTLVKKAKKIKWVNTAYLQQALKGEAPNLATDEHSDCLQGEFFAPQKPYRADEITRAQVPLEEDLDTTPFNVGRLWFSPGSGCFFLYQVENEDWGRWLTSALDLLQHEGLGTDRTVGYGHFEYAKDEVSIEMPDPSGYWLALGLYLPKEPQDLKPTLENERTRWSLVKRGGWISTEGLQTYRKKSLYFFEEGSIFYWPHIQTQGLLRHGIRANIAPESTPKPIPHPIWRAGQTLFLPVQLN